ncbi:hypothetical protein HPB50_004373 [Hyalomma asiaticum]|uniref:Uncharacterized protein n=1 Tax=Hyalomma asiaticum TaxID=266040 RepID=A0ACB7SKG3_HYAAI|nr:hypothetical protein HPB50_004373 [Hyalomma asiaticum]
MAEDLLRHIDELIPCKGFGEEGEFSPNPKRREKTHGGKVRIQCFLLRCCTFSKAGLPTVQVSQEVPAESGFLQEDS